MTMSISLTSWKFKSLGPIDEIKEDLAPLTVVYGRNEDGKTLLLEAVTRCVFKKGIPSSDRDISVRGHVEVAGLADEVTLLKKSSKPKVDEILSQQHSMPLGIGRLLTVRAGDVKLQESGEGSRDALQRFLSSEAIYGKVSEKINKTVATATLLKGVISGASRGEIKEREGLTSKLKEIDEAFNKIDKVASEAERNELQGRIQDHDSRIENLNKAARYKAGSLSRDINTLEQELTAAPSGKAVSEIESHFNQADRLERQISDKNDQMHKAEAGAQHVEWLAAALEEYRRVSVVFDVAKRPQEWLILTALGIATLIGLIFDLKWLAITGLVSVVAYAIASRRTTDRDQGAAVARRHELTGIADRYRELFDDDLKNEADLTSRHSTAIAKQKESSIHVVDITKLRDDLAGTRRELDRCLDAIDHPEFNRDEAIRSMDAIRAHTVSWQAKIDAKRLARNKLGIKPDEYLDKDPGVPFDEQARQSLIDERKDLTERLATKMNQLEALRTDLIGLVEGSGSDTMNELIARLRDQREAKGREYRELTAAVIAGILTARTITELQESEDERLQSTLEGTRLPELVQTLVGRNIKIEIGDGELYVADPGDEEEQQRLLRHLSTGTQEQVLIALRMALAEHVTGGDGLFMLLDDAFQHSDWIRRPLLIQSLKDMVASGWQVIYFTMDDHIRDEFVKAGEDMGANMKLIDLATSATP